MARKKAKALPPKMITVYAEILQETEKAILVRCDDEADGEWLPKSQIKYSGERGDTGVEIEIPELLADEKGFFDGMGEAPIGEVISRMAAAVKPQEPDSDAPGCTSCAHQDSGDDESFDGCGDDRGNYTPIAAATEAAAHGAGAVQ